MSTNTAHWFDLCSCASKQLVHKIIRCQRVLVIMSGKTLAGVCTSIKLMQTISSAALFVGTVNLYGGS